MTPSFSAPAVQESFSAEKSLIFRFAKKSGLSKEEVDAAVWIAHQRAAAQARDPVEFRSKFIRYVYRECKEEEGRRSVKTVHFPTRLNDNGEYEEVEFAACEQEEIEEWRRVVLSDGQEARLAAISAGAAALAEKLGVGVRRGQQRVKQEVQDLLDELLCEQQLSLF